MSQSVAAAAEQIATMSREPDLFGHKPSYHGHGSWIAKWKLAENSDGTIEMATLYVHHWGDRKQYGATVNRTTDGQDGIFSTELSSPLQSTRLPSAPVARYSKKSHEAYARATVALIQSGEIAEQIAHQFDPQVKPHAR